MKEISVTTKWGATVKVWIREDRPGDMNVVDEVLVGDTYRVAEMAKPDGLVWDIGCHIGTFSLAIKSRFPDVQILCVEPHPDNFETASLNLIHWEDAVVLRGAVNYKKGDILADGESASGGGIVMMREDYERRSAKGELNDYPRMLDIGRSWTVEELLSQNPNAPVLAKWDCEGGEVDAFQNMTDAAEQFIKCDMVGEYHMHGGWPAFEALLHSTFPNRKFETSVAKPASVHIGWWRSSL